MTHSSQRKPVDGFGRIARKRRMILVVVAVVSDTFCTSFEVIDSYFSLINGLSLNIVGPIFIYILCYCSVVVTVFAFVKDIKPYVAWLSI
jgi:hypothetical protein